MGLAIGPGIAIGFSIFLKDKHERERARLLLLSFLYGIVTTLVTFLMSIA